MIKVEQKITGLLLLGLLLIALMVIFYLRYETSNVNAIAINDVANNNEAVVHNTHNDGNVISSTQIGEPVADTVHAKEYEQFWIWTAPNNSENLQNAHTLYILQGEIRPENSPYNLRHSTKVIKNHSPAILTPQGIGVRTLSDKKIWLVYRATSKEWSGEVMPNLLNRLQQWERAGNQVMGIQIDYDAPTYKLDKYAQLLADIRKQLPDQYQLSVTGLLDWSNQANEAQFMQLNHIVDELVVQTYQGTTTLANYDRYLRKLENLPFNFKIGVIEGGKWQGASYLEDNPNFKGYVVFLH